MLFSCFPTAEMPLLVLLLAVISSHIHAQDGTAKCLFDDGQVYNPGENVGDSFVNRCGNFTEWPCFCEPYALYQVSCPYCGFSAGDGSLYCARDGETISFQDGSIVRVCSCEFTDDPTVEPIRECIVGNETDSVESPGSGPSFSGQCILPDASGELVEIENGESFGDLIEGACGPPSEWPSFCRIVDNEGNFIIDYPYCVYTDVSGSVVCAKDGGSVSYIDVDYSSTNCTCSYTQEDGPQSECDSSPTAPAERPTGNPSAPVSRPSGEADSSPTSPPTLLGQPAAAFASPGWNFGIFVSGACYLISNFL
jgi:hypothetical protein